MKEKVHEIIGVIFFIMVVTICLVIIGFLQIFRPAWWLIIWISSLLLKREERRNKPKCRNLFSDLYWIDDAKGMNEEVKRMKGEEVKELKKRITHEKAQSRR